MLPIERIHPPCYSTFSFSFVISSFFLSSFIIFFLDFIGVHIDYDVDSISYDDFINRELILFSHAGEKVLFLFDYLNFSFANLIVLNQEYLCSCHPFCKCFPIHDIQHILNIIIFLQNTKLYDQCNHSIEFDD